MLLNATIARISGFFLVLGSLVLTSSFAAPRYAPSPDGQEIADSKTGLVWRRCAEGMVWKTSTCTGTTLFSNHQGAQARAMAEATARHPWRLPTLQELSGIVAVREADEGKAAIDSAAFPATPLARFWSSSSVGHGYFMYVAFTEGSAGEGARNAPGAVRLVRSPN